MLGSVYVDRIPPTVGTLTMKIGDENGNDYTNDTWTKENVYIAVNDGSDDSSGHKSTTYSINGGEATTEPQILAEDGKYTIVVTTTDIAGNVATSTYTVKIDNKGLMGTTNAIKYTNQQTVTVYSKISEDGGTSVSEVITNGWHGTELEEFYKEQTANYDSENNRYYTTFNFSELPNTMTGKTNQGDGTYAFNSKITDSLGNVGKTDTVTVIYDTVAPVWSIENLKVNTENNSLIVDLIGIDEFSGLTNKDLRTEQVSIYIDGTQVDKRISKTLEKILTEEGKVKYTLTLANLEEEKRQSGKKYNEWSGTIEIELAEGSLIDNATNKNEQQKFSLGHVDIVEPDFMYKYTKGDINKELKTVQVVFTVTDKYYHTPTEEEIAKGLTNQLKIEDLTILIDGEEPEWKNEGGKTGVTKELLSEEIKDGDKIVGYTYTLVLSELQQDAIASGKNYLDYSGVVTIGIPEGKVKDTSENTNFAQTITVGIEGTEENIPEKEPSDEEITIATEPYIPEGYTPDETTNLDTGFVIKDSKGNEYVWVEVPKSTSVYKTAGLEITEFSDGEYKKIEDDLHEYTETYRNGTTFTDTWFSEEATGLTESEYNIQKKKMLKSVYQNGGFYVGRYETGYEYNDKTKSPIIQQNAYPYNFVSTKQAQELSESFSEEGYTSSLMFGVQWDLVLKYLETKGTTQAELNTNSTSWGNYHNSTYKITNINAKYSTDYGATWLSAPYDKTSTSIRAFLTTGAIDKHSNQNIYDFAGNIWEWTLEYTNNASRPETIRGSAFSDADGTASHRYSDGLSLGASQSNVGFRTTLYKDEGIGNGDEEPTYIPDDYKHVEGTMETGYVISDSKGNEYVWVEVPRTADVYPTAGLEITEFTKDEFKKIENDLHTYTTIYRNGTTFTDTWSSEEATGMTEKQYNTLKNKMLRSIYKNGGFYVGRYETGIADTEPDVIDTSVEARTEAGETTQTPVIQANAYPYNYVTNAQAQVLSSKFATENYTSSLMFGVQWDLVLRYLESKGATKTELITNSTSWGNFANNLWESTSKSAKYDATATGSGWKDGTYKKTADSFVISSTGASDVFSKQGIYDLAGNVWSWTLENFNNSSTPSVVRGTSYGNSGTNAIASKRETGLDWNGSEVYIGFRVTLYRDEDPEIVDVVDPLWQAENIQIDKESDKVTVDLKVTDKYYETSTLKPEDIEIYIDGTEIKSTDINVTLSQPELLTEARESNEGAIGTRYGEKYTLTLTNWMELFRQKGKQYKEWSGEIKIVIAKGTATDKHENVSQEQEISLGKIDLIRPEFAYKYTESDISKEQKTVKIEFAVTDKYFKESTLKIEDLTILIDGEQPVWKTSETENGVVKTLSSEPIKEERAKADGSTEEVLIGYKYTILLSELEQDIIASGKNYLDYSGVVTIVIPEGKIKDTSDNTNYAQTITVGIEGTEENIPENEPSDEEITIATEPYIPEGYTPDETTNLDTGFVIKDSKGNEYVWVEVPKSTSVYKTAGLEIVDFSDGEYKKIEDDLHEYTTTYRNGTTYTDTWSSETATGLTEGAYNVQKKKMLKSIYKNGGFYVGRYETGIDYSQNSRETQSGDTTQIPVIKQNAYPYNKVTNAQAQILSSKFATEGYTSSLMFGVQWDLILRHLEAKGVTQTELKTNSTNWGNYYDSTYEITNTNARYNIYTTATWNTISTSYSKASGERTLLTTGAREEFAKQNIYDLSGNVWEWTLEKSYVMRGGEFGWEGTTYPTYYRTNDGSARNSVGFRVSLYKDEGIGTDSLQPTYIPEGYKHVEGTMETGYVISDSKGNEYVWVEVPRTADIYQTAGLNITEFSDGEYKKIENDLHTYTMTYRNGTTYTDTWSSEEATGLTESEYNIQKKKMLKSIYKNGGFYVGRYETGYDYNDTAGIRTAKGETKQTPVIQANAYPYTFVSTAQAQKLSSGLATEGYTSNLLFGVQWDLTLRYLESKGATKTELNSNSTSWGNYRDSVWNTINKNAKYNKWNAGLVGWADGENVAKASGDMVLLTTGARKQFSKQEIYDFAGNLYEFTLEYATQSETPCAYRGGYFWNTGSTSLFSASCRYGAYGGEEKGTSSEIGFRVALYRDEGIGTESPQPTYIPDGYEHVEGTMETGYVISDSKGNEFVWVEVPRTVDIYPTAGLNITDFTTEEYKAIEYDLHTYTSTYRNGTTYTDTWSSEVATGLTESEYNIQKKKMLKSIYKNGGFYVGRYETGYAYNDSKGNRTEAGATVQTPVIKKDTYPYNYVTNSQAQTLSRNFTTEGYTSSLMFGVQWDLIMKYLETKGTPQSELKTNSNSWANYINSSYKITNTNAKYRSSAGTTEWNSITSSYIKAAGTTACLTTGASEDFCKQNIYDLAGGLWENTIEYTSVSSNPKALRGASAQASLPGVSAFSANYRYATATDAGGDIGFRVSLYRDEDPITDVVDPVWKTENMVIDKEAGTVAVDLIGQDKYFKENTLTENEIAVKVDGQDIKTLGYVNVGLSEPTPLTEKRTILGEETEVQYGVKYTLTLTDWQEGQTEDVYIDWKGIRSIVIGEKTLTDESENTSKETEIIIEDSKDQYTPSFTNREETEISYTTDSRVDLSYVLYKGQLQSTPYEKGDYRVITTNTKIPVGTKLTLKDYAQNKVYYYYTTGRNSEYEVENNRYIYKLSNFIEIGSVDKKYKDSNSYYNEDIGYALEKYNLSIDFIDSRRNANFEGQETYIELRDASGNVKYGNGDTTIKYNLYAEVNAEAELSIGATEGQTYDVGEESVEIPITIEASILEQNGVLDTKYHDQIAGIGIQIVDSNNIRIKPQDIGTFKITTADGTETYMADETGVIRMPIFEGIGSSSGDYKLTITQQSLSTGTYTVQVQLYTADDGKYYGNTDLMQKTFNVTFANTSVTTIGVIAETKDRLIQQSSETKSVNMIINVDKPEEGTNIRVELYKRKPTYSDINDVNSYTGTQYDLVDINQYLQESEALETPEDQGLVSATDSKEYVITSEVTETAIQFTKQLIDNIATGEYKLVFKAYDENTLVHETSKTFIVVP